MGNAYNEKTYGAGIVVQWVEHFVIPAFHMDVALCPACCTSDSAPC